MEIDKIIINTTSQEGQSIQTTANLGDINFSSVLQEAPQIQTTIQDNIATISSIINAPWVNVTSVNGMTGDIIVEPEILDFQTNHYYPKNTLISYNGNLYWAKQNFTSSSSFDRNDWNQIEATGVSDWADIQNKPNFATVATSGSYTDLSNTPNLATVATTGEYSDLLHTPSLSQVATTGNYNDLSNTPTLATVASSGQYGDLLNKPTNVSYFTNDVNYLRGVNSSDTTPIPATISTSMIQNQAITKDKINWTEIINNSADGKYLLVKDNGSYSFERQSEWSIGETLVITKNTTQLQWSGTTKTLWSNGSWTQFGPMAKTTKPFEIAITTPPDEIWAVKLHHITGTVHPDSSSWSHSGIYQSNTQETMQNFLTTCLVANGDLYIHQETETVVEIPANTTAYFGVWVRTNSTANCLWYGGGTTTSTGSGFNFGNSCVLEAILIGRRTNE